MGKLALGIAAVICLDIAFIAYLYAVKEPYAEMALKPTSNRKPLPPKVAIPTSKEQVARADEALVPVVSENIAVPRTPKRQVESEATSHRKPIHTRAAFTAKTVTPVQRNTTAQRISTESTKVSSNVRIIRTSNSTLILYRGPQVENAASAAPREASKPSFGSRTLRVIKKPWVWVKAAAEKIM